MTSFEQAIFQLNTRLGQKMNTCHDNLGQFCVGGESIRISKRLSPAQSKYDMEVDNNAENALALSVDDSPTSGQEAEAKNLICETLAEKTGFEYEEVNQAIGNWAATSNDNHYGALTMQKDAAELFGTELTDWQKENLNQLEIDKKTTPTFTNFQLPWNDKSNVSEQNKKFLTAMYEQTQADFKAKGITEVTLYRGVTLDNRLVNNFAQGETIRLENNPLESWSINPRVAREFAYPTSSEDRRDESRFGIVLKSTIPVEKILSNARTGFGCLDEKEFVIIGGKDDTSLIINMRL